MISENALNVNNSPSLCSNGCGFFGSPSTKNLCSKCYNDFLKQQVIAKSNKLHAVCPSSFECTMISAGVAAMSINDDDDTKNTKKNRCQSCNKRVGLLGFECRCGGVFCGVHRYAEKHSCTFNFKVIGRDALARANPLCKADRLEDRI